MKITQEPKVFTPVTIVVDTSEELLVLKAALYTYTHRLGADHQHRPVGMAMYEQLYSYN